MGKERFYVAADFKRLPSKRVRSSRRLERMFSGTVCNQKKMNFFLLLPDLNNLQSLKLNKKMKTLKLSSKNDFYLESYLYFDKLVVKIRSENYGFRVS